MEAFAVESYIQTYPGQDVDNARIFSRCHITPNTQFSTMDINATYSMVEAGLGIGINNQVNSSLWQDRVVHLPLKPAQTMNIGLAGRIRHRLHYTGKRNDRQRKSRKRFQLLPLYD